MTRRHTQSERIERRMNLKRHGALSANAHLPEAHDTRYARHLVYTLMATLIAIIVWAASTPVNEVITGSGLIRTRTLPERVEHPDGGIVAEIHVSKGQRVLAGAPLLTFDISSLKRELGKLHATQAALRAERDRIRYLLEDKSDVPNFETIEDLNPSELLFWAEQSYLVAQLDLITSERETIESSIAVLVARRENLTQEEALLKSRLERSRRGQNSGALARNEVERIEREYLQLERTILEVEGEVTARRNALIAIDLQRSELLAKRRREAALRRAEVEDRLVDAALSIAEVDARIARANVTATINGTIMEMAVANPREVVSPGDVIVEVVPAGSAIEAEVEISADRIGNVDVGMEVRLKVLSYDFARFGEIVGHVATISPSSVETEEGQTIFRVTVELPNEEQGVALNGRPVRPGMTVTADILTGSKNVLSYLLKPLRVLGDRAFTEA